LREVLVALWVNRSFRHMLLLFSVLFFFNTGITQWTPSFFIRTYDMQTGQLGTWLTLAFGLSGVVGIYGGGWLASRYRANNERLQLRICMLLFFVLMILRPVAFLMPTPLLALAFIVPAGLMIYIADGPLFAVVQSLVPARMRAMSIALIYLSANLIGLGLGPLVIGALSDLYEPWAGKESLRYALVTVCPGYLWAIWHLWRASRTVAGDIEAVRGEPAAASRPAGHPVIHEPRGIDSYERAGNV
jgi:MFS family permease